MAKEDLDEVLGVLKKHFTDDLVERTHVERSGPPIKEESIKACRKELRDRGLIPSQRSPEAPDSSPEDT